MKADALTITKLYDTLNKAYVIPSYQRPFSWDPRKAIELLDGIMQAAESGEKVTSIGTFLFCNVLYAAGAHPYSDNSPSSRAPNTVWEVVDGQQRLTVLAILAFALREQLAALSAAGLSYSPRMEFDQFFRTSRTMHGQNVPILIRDEDNFDSGLKSELARLLDYFAGNGPLPTTIGDRLPATLTAVTEWVREHLNNANFESFSEYLLGNCICVQVEADDQDTAFMMFEPLNSTSEPLTAFEVYRSKAVRAVAPSPAFSQTMILLDYDNSDRDDVIKRSNDLIFATAQAVSGERPRIHFVPLKHYLDMHVSTDFVSHLEGGAAFYHTIWLQQTSSALWFSEETKNCVRFLRASNHDLAAPLLLRYYLTNPDQIPEVGRAIVAFFALWRPAFPTNKLPDIYRSLLANGRPTNMALDGGTLMTPTGLKHYLRSKLEARLGVPPSGKTIKDVWLGDDHQVFLSYDQLKTICRLFIFLDMGASIKSNLVPDDPWTALDDIEHVMSASATVPPENLHKIGNLTFLPASLNRSIKDRPWTDKKVIYKLLASTQRQTPAPTAFPDGRPLPPAVRDYLAAPNTLAMAHLGPLTAGGTWGSPKITRRTREMLEKVWDILYKQWLT